MIYYPCDKDVWALKVWNKSLKPEDLDEGMFLLIKLFNVIPGVATRWSCSGHWSTDEVNGKKVKTRERGYVLFIATDKGKDGLRELFRYVQTNMVAAINPEMLIKEDGLCFVRDSDAGGSLGSPCFEMTLASVIRMSSSLAPCAKDRTRNVLYEAMILNWPPMRDERREEFLAYFCHLTKAWLRHELHTAIPLGEEQHAVN